MLNPEYADAIVENMAATQLRMYGSVVSEYPNLLKVAVETFAFEDPRYVRKNGESIWIGDAAITTEMQLDVMEKDVAEEVEWETPVNPGGTPLDTYHRKVENIRLNTNDPSKQVRCNVHVDITDYQWESDETAQDTDDLKYARTVRMVFVVQAEEDRIQVPKAPIVNRSSKRKKGKKRR